MDWHAFEIVFWYSLGTTIAVLIGRIRRDYKKGRQRRETLGLMFEAQTPSAVHEVDTEMFLIKLIVAPSYGLVINPVTRRLELIISEGPGEMPEMFTGPDPGALSSGEYAQFLHEVDNIVMNKEIARNRRF